MKKVLILICFLLVCMIAYGGCAAKTASSEYDQERVSALTDEFINDIPTFLEYRTDAENLILTGAVISTDDATYAIDSLETFRQDREDGTDSRLTVVSAKNLFVISRIVFDGKTGYYLRYQRDPANEKDLAVTVKIIDDVKFIEYEDTGRVDLELMSSKATIATFSLKNLTKVIVNEP